MSKRSLSVATRARRRPSPQQPGVGLATVIGLLAVLGMGVAAYMSYNALLDTVPVCGPIGDCETVHTSVYARTFGVPVALLGLLCYLAVVSLIPLRLKTRPTPAYLASLGILVLAVAGTLFSAYLTYVEFFVIYAFCPWCLASAATITSIMVLVGIDVARQIQAE